MPYTHTSAPSNPPNTHLKEVHSGRVLEERHKAFDQLLRIFARTVRSSKQSVCVCKGEGYCLAVARFDKWLICKSCNSKIKG